MTIRVVLPFHLRTLAGVEGDLVLNLPEPVTLEGVLDAVEERYPVLRGTIRDHQTKVRRPFIRFFACREDLSHQPTNAPLPPEVQRGEEPLMVVGAMAGG